MEAKKILRKEVRSLFLKLLSPQEIKSLSTVKIVTPELYDVDGYPVDGGLMDLRMGVIEPGMRCRDCGGTLKECMGHPGRIDLSRPVIHVKYAKLVKMLLKCFCQECGKFLMDEKEKDRYRGKEVKKKIKKARDSKECPYCETKQGKIKLETPVTFLDDDKRIFPNEIRDRLARIPDDQLRLVNINPKTTRPEWAIISSLIVPPVTVRPSITLESGERSEDDLTHKLGDIIRANQRLWENLNAGAPEVIVEDLWDLLQYHVVTFFDNTKSNVPPARHRSGQPLKTITDRIKGKNGRIRHNLTGKRVNYSSRSVISPDPSLDINEVGVPYEIAKIITSYERVTELNIDRIKELIKDFDTYPGANYIKRPDGKRKRITEELKEEILEEIEPGYSVDRHLQDGDVVLFNRHPSLHKQSLMAHFVRVLPAKTFRLHPATCPPYNADFDGDEMNVHGPQNEEARSEAMTLLNVNKNLMASKNNTNWIGCIRDPITGNFLLSKSGLDKNFASQALYGSGVESNFKKEYVSGKDVFSEILPDIDFETKTKSCLGQDCPNYKDCKKEDCSYDAYLKIKNGEVKSGVIDENSIGDEDGDLIKAIDREKGEDVAVDFVTKAFSLGTNITSRKGFSFSIPDLQVNENAEKETEKIIKKAESATNEVVKDYEEGNLELIPGRSLEESREIKILQALNGVRTEIGKIIRSELKEDNPINSMIVSGARGNILNITQASCNVGQQALWGGRVDIGYNDRTLSTFKKKDLSPKSRGFIKNSYLGGLEPYEFFFGSMTGRDSLMDTALRTPKSGYLFRRLSNALQDLKVEYDGTLRDASKKIVQYKYGGDGKSVELLHKDGDIPPGEAAGIITAQSFGEPSTQMALNVFHFAGVQEMQITQGLPRLIEIFDARKSPSTPMMEIHVESKYNNKDDAKEIAEKIKEVKFQDIVSEIKINFSDKRIEATVDEDSLKRTHMSMKELIERLKEKKVDVKYRDNKVYTDNKKLGYKELYKMKEKMKEMIISGVKGLEQVLVVKRDREYIILAAGSNLKEVFKIEGVSTQKTTTNDLHETAGVLGIEAARTTVINEVKKVLNQQGMDINDRHVKLIADSMTYKGAVNGATRIGIISEKSSVLARSAFETPIRQFVGASVRGDEDKLASVVENIILNQPVPVGTGLPGLMVEVTGSLVSDNDKGKKDEVKSDEE